MVKWCAREDSNLHPLRDQILSLACLPFHHARRLDAGKDATRPVRLKPAFSTKAARASCRTTIRLFYKSMTFLLRLPPTLCYRWLTLRHHEPPRPIPPAELRATGRAHSTA